MPTPASDRQRRLFVLFLLAMLPAGNALNPCLDVDTWWHLRVGQYIVEEKRLPDRDPFSQLGQRENVPWIAYSWLYELLLYETYRLTGFGGILALRHVFDLLTFCSFAWFLLRWALSPWFGMATLALATVSLIPLMSERPWHFTILFTVLTLHAVMSIREGARVWRFAWLPVIYVLWANIHIQFVMGFAVLGLGWLVTVVEWLSNRMQPDSRWNQLKGLFLLGAACALATLLNPYHVRLYAVIWEYASQTAVLSMVQELQPPNLLKFQWWNLPLMALLLAAACVALTRRRLWDLVMLGSALFFSLRMQRDIWYGVLISGAIVVRGINSPARDDRKLALCQIVLVSLLSLGLMRFAWDIGLSKGKTIASCHEESYPVEAVEFIRRNQLAGPILNNFDCGGYLIWELPEMPVSVDGRTNLYGEERLTRTLRVWYGKDLEGNVIEDWEDDPDLARAKVVIAPSNTKEIEKKKEKGEPIDIFDLKSPLTERLRESKRWRIVHEDKTAVVFARANSSS